jgi:hypothetical protein
VRVTIVGHIAMVSSGGTIVCHIEPRIIVKAKPTILIFRPKGDDVVRLPPSKDHKVDRIPSMNSLPWSTTSTPDWTFGNPMTREVDLNCTIEVVWIIGSWEIKAKEIHTIHLIERVIDRSLPLCIEISLSSIICLKGIVFSRGITMYGNILSLKVSIEASIDPSHSRGSTPTFKASTFKGFTIKARDNIPLCLARSYPIGILEFLAFSSQKGFITKPFLLYTPTIRFLPEVEGFRLIANGGRIGLEEV